MVVLSPCKVGLCARDSCPDRRSPSPPTWLLPARPSQVPHQNDLRLRAKWLAHPAKMTCAAGKMTCASFGWYGCPWENDLRVDLRLGLRQAARCACSAAHIIFI